MEALMGLACILPFMLLSIAGTVFWIWMLIDCLTKEPSEGNDKIIWVLVMIFLPAIGSIVYYFIRRPERIQQTGQ
jgi:Phospholipase_D-nuclease N-terminal